MDAVSGGSGRPEAESLRPPRGGRWTPLLLVAGAAAVVYADAVPNGFTLDDLWLVVRNPRVTGSVGWRQIWLTPYWPVQGTRAGLYRPLAVQLYRLQWALGGGGPWLFHLASVALHVAVSLLVFRLLFRVVGDRTGALLGALLFAVHPLHTEAVANVVGQAELLSALGVLGACLLWAGRPADRGVGAGRLAGLLACFAAALLSKENAVVLPVLLVALDVAAGRLRAARASVAAWLRRNGVAFGSVVVLVGAYLALRLSVLGALAGAAPAPALQHVTGAWPRVLTALRLWPEYMRLLFFPLHLSPDYSPAVILPVTSPTPLALLGGLLLLATAALALATPAAPEAGLPAAWFLVAVLPVSNLIVPIGALLAERTLYLPSVGLCLAAAWAWPALRRRVGASAGSWAVPAAGAAAGVVLALLSARTVLRNPDWKSDDRLMARTLEEFPMSYRAQWSAAAAAAAARDPAEALRHWRLAYRLWPYDPVFDGQYGEYLVRLGRDRAAVAPLTTAARSGRRPDAWAPLAQALEADGKTKEAAAARDSARAHARPRAPDGGAP